MEEEEEEEAQQQQKQAEEGIKVGDHVEWRSRVAHREGRVVEKLHPKFIVVDEQTGKEYVRNPDKLHKLPDD